MRVIRSLLDNLLTLLLAFVLAIVIWVLAVRADDPVEVRTFELSVTTINLPAGALLLDISDTLTRIEVEGAQSDLEIINGDNFSAVVDLSVQAIGTTPAEIQIQFTHDTVDPDNLAISNPFPAQTNINLDRLVTVNVPIALTVSGEVARGHEQGAGFTDPDFIEVTGPSTRVNQLAEARVTLFVEGQQSDVTALRRPIFYDQAGNVASITGLTTNADQIRVSVPVNELAGFANKPVTVDWSGTPAAGYRLLDVNVTPANVLVTGSPANLEQIRLIQTEPIDISGLTGTFTQQISLIVPDVLQLDEIEPIFVEFVIEPILDTIEVESVPEIRALGEELTATLDAEVVTVVLFGPVPILDTLVAEDVRVTLDLFGLGVGEHSVTPSVDIFAEQIDIRSTSPAQITVFITNVITMTETVSATVPISGSVPITGTVPVTDTVPTTDTLNIDIPLFAMVAVGGTGRLFWLSTPFHAAKPISNRVW